MRKLLIFVGIKANSHNLPLSFEKRGIAGLFACLILVLALLASCGSRTQDDCTKPSPTPYEEENYDLEETPYPLPFYIPAFDHYDVNLTVDPATRTVTGITRTTFTNRTSKPLETIMLRVYMNAFGEDNQVFLPEFEQSIFRHGLSYGHMDIQHVTINNEDLPYVFMGTILSLYPEEPLAPWETVQLVLQYSAYIPTIAHHTGANDRAMWFGMFLPILAVLGDDGWLVSDCYLVGNPFLLGMASFEVEIVTPADYIVTGTGVTTEEIPIVEADTRVTVFTATNARSFAFAISPYFRRLTSDNGEIHLYYYSNDLPVDTIMEMVSFGMESLSNKIGQYPFGHISIVETDMFMGAMSFSNIVFMDTEVLKNPDAMAITRALGQQWFPNIVGSNQADEAWLDRGLIRYIVAQLFDMDIPRVYERITGWEETSLRSNLGSFSSWADYFLTHHVKGVLMFDALEQRMGEELFWELIYQYFQTFYFRIATGKDFFLLAEEIYGESLEDFIDQWFEGEDLN